MKKVIFFEAEYLWTFLSEEKKYTFIKFRLLHNICFQFLAPTIFEYLHSTYTGAVKVIKKSNSCIQ